MKGLVGRTLGRVETGISSTEKAGNRTKTKSQLPTNSIREVWTSRGLKRSGPVPGWTEAARRRDQRTRERWQELEKKRCRARYKK